MPPHSFDNCQDHLLSVVYISYTPLLKDPGQGHRTRIQDNVKKSRTVLDISGSRKLLIYKLGINCMPGMFCSVMSMKVLKATRS